MASIEASLTQSEILGIILSSTLRTEAKVNALLLALAEERAARKGTTVDEEVDELDAAIADNTMSVTSEAIASAKK